MTHDEIAEIAFEVIRTCHERGITDPLRLAHAVAVALKTAEGEWAERGGEDWTDPTPEQIAACAAYDPDPEQYGTAAPTGPAWVGTVLESCIRDVALGRIASHSSVTAEMVAEWRRLNPSRAAR